MLGIRLRVWLLAAVALGTTWALPALLDPVVAPEAVPVLDAPGAGPPTGLPPTERLQLARPAEPAAQDDPAPVAAPRIEHSAAVGARPSGPPGLPPLLRGDAELAILDEEAARAALRRGLAPPEAEASRRALSDELLIDHLVADVYRTTIFPRQLDAVGESRSAARSLLAALSPAERRLLLREALEADDGRVAPVFEASRDAETSAPASED